MRTPLVCLLVRTVMVCVPSARRPRRTVDLLLLETASCSYTSGYILNGSLDRAVAVNDYLFGWLALPKGEATHNYLCEVNIDSPVEVSSHRYIIRESHL